MKRLTRGLATYDRPLDVAGLKALLSDLPDDGEVFVSQGMVRAEWNEEDQYIVRPNPGDKYEIYDRKRRKIIASSIINLLTAETFAKLLNDRMP